MSASVLILVILALSLIGYWLGRSRALAQEQSSNTGRLQALPQYHGYYVALWCGLPALALLLVWLLAQGPVIDRLLVAMLPAELTEGASPGRVDLLVATIKNAASGLVFGEPDPAITAAAERYGALRGGAQAALAVVVLASAIAGLVWARHHVA